VRCRGFCLGGPLLAGDIEDVAGRSCVVCPWHQFRVDIKSGEAFVAEKDGRLTPVGVKQRVHSVVENDSGVYVRLEESDPPALDSDEYATGKQFVPKNKENGG